MRRGSSWGNSLGGLTTLFLMQNRGGGAAELTQDQSHAGEGGAAGAAQVYLCPSARAPARWLSIARYLTTPAQGGW